ncbi:MAG: anaerobic ribonucleoside-triphosphate reductase [Enterocloster bolteae]
MTPIILPSTCTTATWRTRRTCCRTARLSARPGLRKPHSFSTACNIATQIIAQVASNQYGGQSISLAHLAPFVDVSRKKIYAEVQEEVKTFGCMPSEEVITRSGGKQAPQGGYQGCPDHPVSGHHADDHQRTGPLPDRVHVPE